MLSMDGSVRKRHNTVVKRFLDISEILNLENVTGIRGRLEGVLSFEKLN